jgi:hypothetical protein
MHETINGYPILATYFTPAGDGFSAGRILLVDRGEKHGTERYIVAWQRKANTPGACWYKGWEEHRYYRTLKEGRDAFIKRVKKESA